jgi:hypothetical protein
VLALLAVVLGAVSAQSSDVPLSTEKTVTEKTVTGSGGSEVRIAADLP